MSRRGSRAQLIIKDRPSNHGKAPDVAALATTYGVSEGVRPVYVWESLTSSRKAIEAPADISTYNHHPRNELLAMLTAPPLVVLDVGCAAGATGAELKRRYPHAVVTGVELNEVAAAFARTRLDRVLSDNTLVRLKPFLAPDAQILASIPNVRGRLVQHKTLRN